MKIAYLFADWKSAVLGPTGHSIHVQEICHGLVAEGHEVFILAARRGNGPPRVPRFPRVVEVRPPLPRTRRRERRAEDAGAPRNRSMDGGGTEIRRLAADLSRVAWLRVWSELFYREARPVIARERPDALYERYVAFGYAGAKLSREFDLPLALEMNASFTFRGEWWHPHTQQYVTLMRRAERSIAAAADRVLVVSPVLERYLAEIGVDDGRVEVMENGVDTERFVRAPDLAVAIRRRHGIPTDALVVGFLGSLKPWHDLDLVLAAVPSIVERFPAVRFLIAGGGPEQFRLSSSAEAQGLARHVTFTGTVEPSEAVAYINAMDIALAPIFRVPIAAASIKVFEYMACERPIVASLHDGVADVLTDRVDSLLVPAGDVSALAAAVCELLGDGRLRERLGRNARRTVGRHTWRGNAARIAAILTSARTASC